MKMKLKCPDEHEAMSRRWRRWLPWKPGERKAIKARLHRRERRTARLALRLEAVACLVLLAWLIGCATPTESVRFDCIKLMNGQGDW